MKPRLTPSLDSMAEAFGGAVATKADLEAMEAQLAIAGGRERASCPAKLKDLGGEV